MTEEKKKRGFATLSPERRSEISRKGAIEAGRRGTAHRWTREEAKIAGRKGGKASHSPKTDIPPEEGE